MRLGKINLDQKEIVAQNIIKNIERGMVEIAPLVTKNLIERFEKTGSSPVFLKDGQITGLKFIKNKNDSNFMHSLQFGWLEKGIVDCNFSLSDFWFLEYDETEYQPSGYVLNGKILVVARQSGKSKEYKVGNDSTFPNDLIDDIKNDFFS